jgi:hypothetical protein
LDDIIEPESMLPRPALLLCALGSVAFALDPAQDLLLWWPEADVRALPAAKEIGAGALFIPFSGAGDAAGFAGACRQSGLVAIAEIRGAKESAALEAQAEAALAAGFAGLAFDARESEAETRRLVSRRSRTPQFVYLKADQAGWDVRPAWAVLAEGQWPGIKPRDPATASATEQPWIDSNLWLYAWLRARFPARPAVLGYRPDPSAGVPPDRLLPHHTVEVALTEARAMGGNVILSLPENYRRALLAGEGRAREDWAALARTAAFLKRHADRFASPPGVRVVALAGSIEQSGEVLNLLYRTNATPAVVAVERLPEIDPARYPIAVAANVTLSGPEQERLLAFVKAGGTLLVAPENGAGKPWWNGRAGKPIREEDSRTTHELGKGRLVAYREPVVDAYEFALDVLEALGWKSRDLRLWNADTVVGLVRRYGGGLTLELLDYGTRWRRNQEPDLLVEVHGAFPQAVLEAPELDAPVRLDVRVRQGRTEFEMRDLRHFVTIRLEAGKP